MKTLKEILNKTNSGSTEVSTKNDIISSIDSLTLRPLHPSLINNKNSEFSKEVANLAVDPAFLDDIQKDLEKIDLNKTSEEDFVSEAKDILRKKLMKRFNVD